jgi:hypothetical protein
MENEVIISNDKNNTQITKKHTGAIKHRQVYQPAQTVSVILLLQNHDQCVFLGYCGPSRLAHAQAMPLFPAHRPTVVLVQQLD